MSGRNWSRRTIEEMIDGYIRLHPPGGGGGGGGDVMGNIGAYMRCVSNIHNAANVFSPDAGDLTVIHTLFDSWRTRLMVGLISKHANPLSYFGSSVDDKHYVDLAVPSDHPPYGDKIIEAFRGWTHQIYFTFCPSGTYANIPRPYTYGTNLQSSPEIFKYVKFENIFGDPSDRYQLRQQRRTYIGNIYPNAYGAELEGIITGELYKLKFSEGSTLPVNAGGDPYRIGCDVDRVIVGEETNEAIYATQVTTDSYLTDLLNSQEVAATTHTVLGDNVGCELVIMTLSAPLDVEETYPELTDEFALNLFNWALWYLYVERQSPPNQNLIIHPEWFKNTVVDLPVMYPTT